MYLFCQVLWLFLNDIYVRNQAISVDYVNINNKEHFPLCEGVMLCLNIFFGKIYLC